MSSMSALLTTIAAAAYLGLSRPTLERLRVSGDGPPFAKLTAGPQGAVLYRTSDLDKWVAGRIMRSTGEAWSTALLPKLKCA